jgi:hypothetical protein
VANIRSSLATAASALHRERDHEAEMDAITVGETVHLKRNRNSFDWGDGA